MSSNNSENEINKSDSISLGERVYELRKQGLTFQKIGDTVGISCANAYNKYKTYIEEKRRQRKGRKRKKRQ